MDPLRSPINPQNRDSLENTDDNDNNQNPTVMVDKDKGHVCIRIEGSHTTASETDNENRGPKENKNVKFEDELKNIDVKGSNETPFKEMESQEIKKMKTEVIKSSTDEPVSTKSLPKCIQLEKVKFQQKKTQKELQQIEQENKEIAERFKQILGMFEAFNKNLDTLEMPATPSTSHDAMLTLMNERRPKSEILIRKDRLQPSEHRSRYSDYYNKQEKTKQDQRVKPIKTDCKESKTYAENCSTSTATTSFELATNPKPLQTLACQTSLDDRISNYDLSSFTNSKTEMQASLNNYANADNACLAPLTSSQAIKKNYKEKQGKSTNERPTSIEFTAVIDDETPRHPLHTINIEVNATPSSSDLRRQPFCHRVLSMISDFCGAIFICLQVNRDCIFCFGFVVAFVVSASFLTAFFYRTLSMSSTLMQVASQQQAKGNEIGKNFRAVEYPYYKPI